MEAQSERRRKGYPLQQSSHTEWIAFVSALAQFSHRQLCNYATFNQTHPAAHSCNNKAYRQTCIQLRISLPGNTYVRIYLIIFLNFGKTEQ